MKLSYAYHTKQRIKSSSALTVQNSVGYLSQKCTAATEDMSLPLTTSNANNNLQVEYHITQQWNSEAIMLLTQELNT